MHCRSDAITLFHHHTTYRLEAAVLVELIVDLLPHVGKHSGHHDKSAGGTKAERPREGYLKGGLVEVKTLGTLVHDEEYW